MKNRNETTKKAAFIGLFTALALLLSYVEVLLPPLFVSVPGIKMGLANIAIIYILFSFGIKYAFAVSIVRVFVVSMLFGSVLTLCYSVAGAVLSLVVMGLLKKFDFLSEVGVSVAGGVCHNIGQILVAVALLGTPQIAYYLIVLTFTGIVSGTFVGLCSAFLVKRLPFNKFN